MMVMANYYDKAQEGLSPFVLGRDYMPNMKSVFINKDPKPKILEERKVW